MINFLIEGDILIEHRGDFRVCTHRMHRNTRLCTRLNTRCAHEYTPVRTPNPIRQIRGLLNLSVNRFHWIRSEARNKIEQHAYIGNVQGSNMLCARFTHADAHSNTQMRACAYTQHTHQHARFTRRYMLNRRKYTLCIRVHA